jgi:hypothetical protein
MVILEFHYPEIFRVASSLLNKHGVRCVSESAMDERRASFIFLFEENAPTGPQQKGLEWARGFEREDHRRWEYSLFQGALPSPLVWPVPATEV